MVTETEKMLNGKIYDPSDSELAKLRTRAHCLSKDYNDTYETDEEKKKEILDTLIPNKGKGLFLQGPIQFDYGIRSPYHNRKWLLDSLKCSNMRWCYNWK